MTLHKLASCSTWLICQRKGCPFEGSPLLQTSEVLHMHTTGRTTTRLTENERKKTKGAALSHAPARSPRSTQPLMFREPDKKSPTLWKMIQAAKLFAQLLLLAELPFPDQLLKQVFTLLAPFRLRRNYSWPFMQLTFLPGWTVRTMRPSAPLRPVYNDKGWLHKAQDSFSFYLAALTLRIFYGRYLTSAQQPLSPCV